MILENIGKVPKVAQEMIGQSWFVAICSLIPITQIPSVQVELGQGDMHKLRVATI